MDALDSRSCCRIYPGITNVIKQASHVTTAIGSGTGQSRVLRRKHTRNYRPAARVAEFQCHYCGVGVLQYAVISLMAEERHACMGFRRR